MKVTTNSHSPLSGIRVIDLTHVWAGPKCTQILADLGADVIKVEAPRRSDPARGITALLGTERYPDGVRGDRPHNRSGYFNVSNRSKRGISVDLASHDGKEIFKDLVATSDIVIENFRSGVMDRLELGYDVLSASNPGLIMMSMSGFGASGPEASYVAYADTLEALAGLTGLTGYEGSQPLPSFRAYSDPLNGILGVFAVLAALRSREDSGHGQLVELAQLEGILGLTLPALVEFQQGVDVRPRGNTHPARAPYGLYPCADARWLAIDVGNEEWRGLCTAIGRHDLGVDEGLADVTGRLARRGELDQILIGWTTGRDSERASAHLGEHGVPASIVADVADVIKGDQLRSRGVFSTIEHAEVGPYSYYVGTHARFPHLELSPPRPAPLFGEHTFEVLSELLGLSTGELKRLEGDGIISRDYLGPPLQ